MKARILLAPVLLASLSMACGKTEQKSAVKAETAPADAAPVLTSGVKAIDTICAKSFKALAAETLEEIQALQLTATSNATCQKLLITSAGNLLTELSALGFDFALSSTANLDAASFSSLMAQDPSLGDVLASIFDSYRADFETNAISEANEKLEYIQVSIDEINARGPELSPADSQNLAMLNLSLAAQQESLGSLTQRVQKIASFSNLASLAGGVAYVGQVLGQPLTPDAGAPAATPTEPTPTNTGTTSPEPTPTNTPENGPETPAPQPEPEPAPEPGPNPAPAPAPIPVP